MNGVRCARSCVRFVVNGVMRALDSAMCEMIGAKPAVNGIK